MPPDQHCVRKLFLNDYPKLVFPNAAELSRPIAGGPAEPFGLKRVGSQVDGRGFFPASSGLWTSNCTRIQAWHPFPNNPIFLVGQDLDSEESFAVTLKKGFEEETGAWAGINQLRDNAGLPTDDCYFTNFLPGIRVGSESQDLSPAWGFPKFVQSCHAFFELQIRQFKPRAIFMMGKWCSNELLRRWDCLKDGKSAVHDASWVNDNRAVLGLDGIDRLELSVGHAKAADHRFAYGVLTHPSNRAPNLKRRSYQGLCGNAAEKQIITDVLAKPSLS